MEQLPLSALSAQIYERAAISRQGETVLKDVQYGGPPSEDNPGDLTDRRLYLDTRTLRQLLEVAENSLTGRVVIHHAGLRCRQYLAGAHKYEVLTLVGDQPVAENLPGFRL